MKTKIKVTREHIRKGYRFSSRRCPVALAILDSVPNAKSSAALSHVLRVSFSDSEPRYGPGHDPVFDYFKPDMEAKTPRIARGFIKFFDRFSTALPISFWVEWETT